MESILTFFIIIIHVCDILKFDILFPAEFIIQEIIESLHLDGTNIQAKRERR